MPVQVGLLRCYPDLAGRLAQTGSLPKEAANDQRIGGLLDITAKERQFMDMSNNNYKRKFGFTFVICLRENKKETVMKEIVRRLDHSSEQEIKNGIAEVEKIAWLRICDIIDPLAASNL